MRQNFFWSLLATRRWAIDSSLFLYTIQFLLTYHSHYYHQNIRCSHQPLQIRGEYSAPSLLFALIYRHHSIFTNLGELRVISEQQIKSENTVQDFSILVTFLQICIKSHSFMLMIYELPYRTNFRRTELSKFRLGVENFVGQNFVR